MIDFKYEMYDELKKFLDNSEYEEINIGCSDTRVIKITKEGKEYFLKIGKEDFLHNEFIKLDFLQSKLPVPSIVLHGIREGVEYIVTTRLPGEMVCSNYYIDNPIEGINVIAQAFNTLHNVNINDCPINVALDYKLSLAENNLRQGLIKDENINEDILDKFGSSENILQYLKNNKFDEELCFSHGDMSLPNIFAENGGFSGFIDVGECGIADKWFDIAIVIKSIIRNYGNEYVEIFLDKINVKYDEFKYNYYMLLMQLYL